MKKFIIFLFIVIISSAVITGTEKFADQNETVKDNYTKLTWIKCPLNQFGNPIYELDENCPDEMQASFTWKQAINACHDLDYGGWNDWRLPSIEELHSIVFHKNEIGSHDDDAPKGLIDTDYFIRIKHTKHADGWLRSYFWSSSSSREEKTHAWILEFHFASIYQKSKDTLAHVRCVRGPDPD